MESLQPCPSPAALSCTYSMDRIPDSYVRYRRTCGLCLHVPETRPLPCGRGSKISLRLFIHRCRPRSPCRNRSGCDWAGEHGSFRSLPESTRHYFGAGPTGEREFQPRVRVRAIFLSTSTAVPAPFPGTCTEISKQSQERRCLRRARCTCQKQEQPFLVLLAGETAAAALGIRCSRAWAWASTTYVRWSPLKGGGTFRITTPFSRFRSVRCVRAGASKLFTVQLFGGFYYGPD